MITAQVEICDTISRQLEPSNATPIRALGTNKGGFFASQKLKMTMEE